MSYDVSPDIDGAIEHEPAVGLSLRKIVWPIVLSLLMLIVIGIFTFRPSEFRQIVGSINVAILGVAVLALVVRVFLGGWRLNLISRGRLGLAGGIRGQLAWDFFSNVTPSAIGGAPFAAVYVARDKQIDMGESTACLLFSMLLDQLWFALTIPVVLAASFWYAVIPESLGDVGVAGFTIYFVGMLVWVTLFGYATLYRPDIMQRLASRIFRIKWLRRFHDRVNSEMRQLRHRARILRSQPFEFYVKGILLTIGAWCVRYLFLLFIVWSFFADFDKVLLLLRTAAMTLGSLVLPTPGGAGGIEGLYALFIGPLIPAAVLAPTLLAWRFLGYYLFVGLGVFLSTHHVQKTRRRKLLESHVEPDGASNRRSAHARDAQEESANAAR